MGLNGWDSKERGSGTVFRKGKFELLTLTKTKLDGMGRCCGMG